MPLCTSESIFDEQFGGFWFEEYLRDQCPLPACNGSLITGWEYIGTAKDARGHEKLVGQWWIYCPECGYAKKSRRKER